MDTQTLNNTPTNGSADDKSDKMKKIVGESAKFAAAAGLGVAGTMVTNAMSNTAEISEDTQSEPISHMAHDEESTVETVENTTDFNPNDIMIEDVEEDVLVTDSHHETVNTVREDNQNYAEVEELQPITGESIDVVIEDDSLDIAIVDVDNPTIVDVIIDVDPVLENEEDFLEPDWNTLSGESSELLASEDFSDPDVLGDILA